MTTNHEDRSAARTAAGTLALNTLRADSPHATSALADLRALMAAAVLWEQCAGDWKARAEAAEADNARLRAALVGVLDEADRYSDEMCRIGRGSMEFGSNAPGHSISGMARAALTAHGSQEVGGK